MTPLGWTIILICVIVGFALAKYLFKKYPNLLDKDNKKMQEIINNPHLLVEKLKEHGKIYTEGKELNIQVGQDKETGQEVVVVEEMESKRAKQVEKKASKGKVQNKKKIKLSKSHKKGTKKK